MEELGLGDVDDLEGKMTFNLLLFFNLSIDQIFFLVRSGLPQLNFEMQNICD